LVNKQLSNLKESVQQRAQAYLRKLSDWLYEKDITRSRVKHYARMVVFAIVLLGVYTLLLYAASVPLIPSWIVGFARGGIGVLLSLGEQLKMPNPSEFVTVVVGEVVAFALMGLLNIIVIRHVVRQPNPPKPEIVIRAADFVLTMTKGKSTVSLLTVQNRGDTAALACQGRIIFDDLDQRDILDVPKVKSNINSKTFVHRSMDRSTLPWISYSRLLFPQKPKVSENMDIRAGHKADLGVLKVVPAQEKAPEHFEVLISTGAIGAAIVCLKPKHYYGKIMVTPLNGKSESSSFQITSEQTTSGERQWVLRLSA
jgi:hypothetical protein